MARDKEKEKAYQTAWKEANKDKIAAYNAVWKKKNKEKLYLNNSAYDRFKKTGVTQEQYDAAYLTQKGVCAICFCVCSTGKKLATDHCHTTGVFRGLLCMKCNTGLGKFNDNLTLVRNAMNYLKQTQ